MARVQYVTREDLPEDKQHIYDRIAGTRGVVVNMFRSLLNSPDICGRVSQLGEYIRYNSPLDPAVREIAILATARECGSEYEWSQHEPVAREAGVTEEVLDAIRSGRAPMGIPPRQGVFVQAAKELLRDGTLSDVTFQAVEHLVGPLQTVDLIVLVGYYAMIARAIRALGVELEEGKESSLKV